MLEIKDLDVKVKNEDKVILNKLSLNINKGEVHVIMGPNGTGKSTLSKVITGYYKYEVTGGDILFEGKSILDLTTDERARLGIFLAMQDPISIEGLSNSEFLKTAISETTGEKVGLFEFIKTLEKEMKNLKLNESMLHRSLNQGFSGGEKKKNEVLQLKLLKPKFIILDELDSGLDVDSLRIVCDNINSYLEENRDTSVLIITHYPRILDYIKPNYVHVIKGGTIVKTGDISLADTIEKNGFKEQNPEEWYSAFCALSHALTDKIPAKDISALIFSGQMQDVIPVGSDLRSLGNAILYSDGRAGAQAEAIENAVGSDTITAITGNHFDGSMPLAKILWLKENQPEIYEKAAAFLISSKDYVVARLTGNFIGDMTACATAGAMDLEHKTWSEHLINDAGLDINKFPKLLHSHELAGVIAEKGAADTGYLPGTKVYAGTGDAGATTLASGILAPGEYNVNLGTSSWVAAVSKGRMDSEGGGFNLAAMQKDLYINVVPFLNGGNVHRFIARILSRELDHKPDFAYISHLLKNHVPGSHGVFFLPYLTGERFPIMDSHIRASFLGLSQDTSATDMAGSVLEGVAFSIRHGLELFICPAVKLSIIGGGARELAWCQILSNVMGLPVHVYKDPDLLPALAIASSVFLAENIIPDYQSFIHVLEEKGGCTVLEPDPDAVKAYKPVYEKYKTIYPMIREFYHEV